MTSYKQKTMKIAHDCMGEIAVGLQMRYLGAIIALDRACVL